MTKDGLINAVFENQKLDTKVEASRIVTAVFSLMESTLATGEEVALTGFGSFRITRSAARQGRNPKTGEAISIPASNKVKFRAGANLKSAVK